MELEELKQKWNRIDKSLSKSEVFNRRVLEETIRGKNQTTYESLRKQAIYSLVVSLGITAGLIPLLHIKGIFHDASFYVLEALCVLGILMVVCRLMLLSRFNVMKAPVEQLHALANYKREYVLEHVLGFPFALLGICTTLYLEQSASAHGYFFIALFVIVAAVCGWSGWTKHRNTMQEVERHLAELREFEQEGHQ